MQQSRLSPWLVPVLAVAITVPACGDDDGGTTPPPPPPPADGGLDATRPDDAGADAGPTGPRPECENLNPNHCLLPWPSSRYLVDDPSSRTGKRLALPIEAMPVNRGHDPVDPTPYNTQDGFSPMTSMMTVFPGHIDPAGLADANHIERSLTDASPTVVLDAETGERVPHFAELDGWTDANPELRSFYIRPAVRLREDRSYIVAIRRLRTEAGDAVEPSDYFRALRDGTPGDDDELEGRRAHFEELFTTLTAAGVARDELVEAWDFHTGSGETWWRDLITMRDDALERVGPRGLGCTVTAVEEDPTHPQTFRVVRGTFTVPLYTESARPGTPIVRGPDGLPRANGTAEAPFIAVIPNSARDRVAAGEGPARLLTFGHGLMGDAGELLGGFARNFTNNLGMVAVGTDWWGMSSGDIDTVAYALSDFSTFPLVTGRLMQGVVNTLVLTRSFAGVCSELPELQLDGQPLIDVNERYFLGLSQGSIMGLTTAGVSTDIERFVLGVGGISYPVMIPRSVNFPPYLIIMRTWYPSKLDRDLLMVAAAQLWDYSEPATYAPHVIADPLPGTPAKRILYQVGVNDAQVSNDASDLAARTMGIPLLAPSPRTPFGLEVTTEATDSAIVYFDFGDPAPPAGSTPPESENQAHEGVRRNARAQEQMDRFFRLDGRVEPTCDGPCDPS